MQDREREASKRIHKEMFDRLMGGATAPDGQDSPLTDGS